MFTSPCVFVCMCVKMLMAEVHIERDLTVQEVHVCLGGGAARVCQSIVVVYGTSDDLTAGESEGTFCNKPWAELYQRTGVTASDLWFPGQVGQWVVVGSGRGTSEVY